MSYLGVQPAWLSDPYAFVEYLYKLDGWFEGVTIDRIDNKKGYIAGNLRWATVREQALNKNTTTTVKWDNKEMSLREFIEKHTPLSCTQGYVLYHKGRTLAELAHHRLSGTGPKKQTSV